MILNTSDPRYLSSYMWVQQLLSCFLCTSDRTEWFSANMPKRKMEYFTLYGTCPRQMDRSPLEIFLIKFLVSCQNSLPTAIRSHGCHQIQIVTHPSYRWCGTSGAGSPASSSSGSCCSPPTSSTLSGAIQIQFITFWVRIIDTDLWLQFSWRVLSRWMGKHFACLRTILVHLQNCCFQDSIL